eukprot:g14726.t1
MVNMMPQDDFDEGLENFFDLQSVPEAQELGSTERTAELAQTRPQGPKLLSEVCRRVREAAEKQFEQEIAEMGPTGNVAWFLSKALNTGCRRCRAAQKRPESAW